YYIGDIPEAAEMLLEAQNTEHRAQTDLPEEELKPMTIIYPHGRNMAKNLIAEDGSIGIRITNEAFSKALCAQLRHPLVSTSANISGHPTARFYHEIEREVLDGVDYVCRFRRDDDTPHEPSTLIKINDDGSFKIIRS
ncbi:MAG: Sua5/YciO/YrdC/YwlC family protein, partial [Paludibacteraceae bacterium]|nr:Sua5/YciO/YrdC/YwlC family protein [Paludibacteraceae bacterium]